MKAHRSTPPPAPGRRVSRRARVVAVSVVALFGLSACTSDPGPRRVARDIIESEALADPSIDETCLLERLKDFDDDTLNAIEADLDAENSERNAEGEAALEEYRVALAECQP